MRKYQRGRYLATNDVRWIAIRRTVLAEEPHCRECLANGKRELAEHVDHISGSASKPEDYRRENLQALCWRCHSSKTMREQNRARGFKVAVGCDIEGFPILRRG